MNALRPKVQHCKKLGHLWQVKYGFRGYVVYGYGVTKSLSRTDAAKTFAWHQTKGHVC